MSAVIEMGLALLQSPFIVAMLIIGIVMLLALQIFDPYDPDA